MREDVRPEAATALRTIREAMIAFPEYMSGTGEFDGSLIRAFDGRLVCKGGAEGVLALSTIDPFAAVVIKIIDGNERARISSAERVDRARDQLLARAGLALDEDRRLRVGDPTHERADAA